MQRKSLITRAVILLVVSLQTLGCGYHGRQDAISQRFTWFSYLNGDDIRRACQPGALDRFRFVYNGVYVQQVRTYDFAPDPQGSGYVLHGRLLGPSDLSNIVITDPLSGLIDDPLSILAPFAGKQWKVTLAGRDIDAFDSALATSGFFQPPPDGLYLRSEDFFWIGVACIGGQLTFNAWRYPSSRFASLKFPQLLLSWDPTGVPVNPPRTLSDFDIYHESDPHGRAPQFTLTVQDGGLAGTGTLF